jgi:uncharacterized protein YegL
MRSTIHRTIPALCAALSLGLASGAAPARAGAAEAEKVPDARSMFLAPAGAGQLPTPFPAQRPRIDVVFVLDTTGSMGGLIAGAKAKIWSIANHLASARPAPLIRMGLVGFRDRGDEYITTVTPLTDDLDAVYGKLMAFSAGGGGDTPESVNQALSEAVTRFAWNPDPAVYKVMFLVGDAPPHMDYANDVLYPQTCTMAVKAGIVINTIQCGGASDTKAIWQDIAQRSEGTYAQVEQDGGAVEFATPYDADMARLSALVEATRVYYGDARQQMVAKARVDAANEACASAPVSAVAARAAYNACPAGAANFAGRQELVADDAAGAVQVGALASDQLPVEWRDLDAGARLAKVAELAARRQQLQEQISGLQKQRGAYIAAETAKRGGKADLAFDAAIVAGTTAQAARKGIVLEK